MLEPRITTNAELEAREASEAARSSSGSEVPSGVVTELARHIEKCFAAAKKAKIAVEARLVDCAKRRKGEYDAEKLAQLERFGGVQTYLKYTGMKCRAAKSWMKDVVLPVGAKPWGLQPTPIPELPASVETSVADAVMADVAAEYDATSVMPDESAVYEEAGDRRDEVEAGLEDVASERAQRMERKIEDQLVEGTYAGAMDEFLDDLVTYPSAILKGPVVRARKALQWNEETETLEVSERIGLYDDRVSPFDFFPSPQCSSVADGYLIERISFVRRDLSGMRQLPGYDVEAVERILKLHSEGGLSDSGDVVSIADRLEAEGKETQPETEGTSDDRLMGYEFWGSVPGSYLLEWGMSKEEIADPLAEYEIMAIKIGNEVVKALLNPDPLGRRPYYVTSYEKVPGSIWGTSPPELLSSVQDAINAVVRAILDNIGFAASPQTVVALNRLHPSQLKHANKMWPRKIWFTRDSGMGGGNSPVDFTQPTLIAHYLLRVLDKLEKYGDDLSGIPAYTYGKENLTGAGRTASGLNMLLNAASKGIRQVIGYVGSDVVQPRIERQYTWNMLNLSDPELKGDCKCRPNGILGEILKDQIKEDRQTFAKQVLAPEIVMQIIGMKGAAKLLRMVSLDLDMDDLVPTEKEVRRLEAAAMAEAAAQAEAQSSAPGPGEGSGATAGMPEARTE